MIVHVPKTPLDSRFHDFICSNIGSNDFAQDIIGHIILDRAFSHMDYENFS